MKNKKIEIFLTSILLVAVFFQAKTVLAQGCGISIGTYCPVTADENLVGGIITVIEYLLSILGIFFLVSVVIAGIRYMTSGGSEDKIRSAKDAFSSSVFGLAIALLAYAILEVIYGILNS